MAGRPTPPAPVLVVDSLFGVTGVRKSGKRKTLPGGVVVVSACAGPEHIPADLIPSEIHLAEPRFWGVLQVQWIGEVVDLLLERMES